MNTVIKLIIEKLEQENKKTRLEIQQIKTPIRLEIYGEIVGIKTERIMTNNRVKRVLEKILRENE